jgi:hypothetical protein
MRCALVAVILVTSSSFASAQTTEPFGRRMVDSQNVRAAARAEHVTTTGAQKIFFVPLGGTLSVRFSFRSNGSHQADVNVYFNGEFRCGAGISSATFTTGSCTASIPAGSTIIVQLVANGQDAALGRTELLFDVVNIPKAAVVLVD